MLSSRSKSICSFSRFGVCGSTNINRPLSIGFCLIQHIECVIRTIRIRFAVISCIASVRFVKWRSAIKSYTILRHSTLPLGEWMYWHTSLFFPLDILLPHDKIKSGLIIPVPFVCYQSFSWLEVLCITLSFVWVEMVTLKSKLQLDCEIVLLIFSFCALAYLRTLSWCGLVFSWANDYQTQFRWP